MMYSLLEKMAANGEFNNHHKILYIGENPVTNLPTGFARYDTVTNWFQMHNYSFDSYFFDKNQEGVIYELIKTIDLKQKIIICGTHTCYKIALAFLMKQNITNSLVTDISNMSDFFLPVLQKQYCIAINYEELATKIVFRIKQILDGNSNDNEQTIECLNYEIKTFLK